MREFSKPPHKGDEHFDLGIWHPSALPSDKQNGEGYGILQQRVEKELNAGIEDEYPDEAVRAVKAFHDAMVSLVDALPEDEICSRPWTIVIQLHPVFNLISLWPTVAVQLVPSLRLLAQEHGLCYYDPQSGTIQCPETPGITGG